MSERIDDLHTTIPEDAPDERDRIFPPDDLTDDPTLRAVERNLRALLRRAHRETDAHWVTGYRELADPTWYQRGEECTGFALAAIADYHLRRELAADEQLDPDTRADEGTVSRRMLYEMAQRYDARDYEEGSTLRGALKGWRKTGVARESCWPYAPDDEHGEKHGRLDLQRVIDAVRRPGGIYLRILRDDIAEMEANMKRALLLDHPLFVSSRTHVGWINLYLPDRNVIVRPEGGKMLGGHAYVIVGFDERGWWVHNSWGQEWGEQGYALLPYEDFAHHGQDVWFVFSAPYARHIEVPEEPLVRAARRGRDGSDADAEFDEAEPEADSEEPAADAETPAELAKPAAPAAATAPPAPPPARAAGDSGPARPESYSRMWRHLITIADDGRLAPIGTSFGMNFDTLKTMLFLFRQQTAGWSRRRLAIFADGGYWSPGAAVDFYAPLRDELVDNEIYPLFLLWDTPWYASLLGRLYGDAGLALDWSDEQIAAYWSSVGGTPMAKFLAAANSAPAIWAQMGHRAAAACTAEGAGGLLAKSIAYNLTKNPFEIHLIGHGAGDLLLSRLAPFLPGPIRTCNLWAPATTMRRFRDSYGQMLDCGCLEHMTIAALDDESERADTTGPLAGSPLQLVSDVLAVDDIDLDTALEQRDGHLVWQPGPEPVLGLERFLAIDAEIDRHRTARRLDVEIVPGGTHTGLMADRALSRATIADIRSVPHRPEAPSAGGPLATPPTVVATPADPLAMAELASPI